MTATALHIFLEPAMLLDAQAGQFNILNRIATALAPIPVHLHADTPAARAAAGDGWSLLHMQEPDRPRSLCLRRAYHYPFWRIEATNQRWNFDVAQAAFDPGSVDPAQARPFARRWREKLLGRPATRRDGFIFMPLQGRIRDHRSFQVMSPLDMVRATLAADPHRPIRARLHPKESYSAADLRALAALEGARFQLTEAETPALLAACDYVVTQNSAVALSGYFLEKPAVLFAGIDFHHIAGSVPRDGLTGAFARAQGPAPDFAAYLWWFFKRHAINGGAPDVEDQIRARLARHGMRL